MNEWTCLCNNSASIDIYRELNLRKLMYLIANAHVAPKANMGLEHSWSWAGGSRWRQREEG